MCTQPTPREARHHRGVLPRRGPPAGPAGTSYRELSPRPETGAGRTRNPARPPRPVPPPHPPRDGSALATCQYMKSRCLKILVAIALGAGALLTAGALPAPAAPVTVRYLEGVTHGFLVLRGPGGETLAEGDLLQVVRPEGVDSRLIFRFRDGSLYDETVVFTQQKVFTLQSYHLVQRGPAFPEELEVTFDRKGGRYQVRSRRDGGEPETAAGEVELPPDLDNGIMVIPPRHPPKTPPATSPLLAPTPEPPLVPP